MSLRTQRRRRPELPLVPLIDVLVMLVLFAFVTMRFSKTQTLNITLPKVDTAGKNEFRGTLVIGLDAKGQISFNERVISDGQLLALLKEVKGLHPDAQVLIKADKAVPFERVTFVWDSCRKVGLNKHAMQMAD